MCITVEKTLINIARAHIIGYLLVCVSRCNYCSHNDNFEYQRKELPA